MVGDFLRFGTDADEWLLCRAVDACPDDLSGAVERLPPSLAERQLQRAFAQGAPGLRAFAQHAGITGGEPLWRMGEPRLRALVLKQIASGALRVVTRTPHDDTAKPAVADAKFDRAHDELAREFRYVTRGAMHFEGRSYELLTGVQLADGRDLDELRIVPRDEARRVLARSSSAPTSSAALRTLLEKASPQLSDDTAPPGSARLLLAMRVSQGRPIAAPDDAPAPTTGRKLPTDDHWVDFRFKDAAGRPLNAEYRLALPNGQDQKGFLGGSGKVHADGQPSGSANIELVDLEQAGWSTDEIGAHEPVELRVQASRGFAPGETVKVEIFRLYRERDDDAVARLEAKLDAARQATLNWSAASLDSPDDSFVFKASIRKTWRKSAPLAVRHRATAAEWSVPQAREGDTLTLRAALSGVADGASATLGIFEKQWRSGASTQVDTLTASVNAGAVETTWAVPAAATPPGRGSSGRRDFHYTVEAAGLHCTSTHVVVLPAVQESP